MNSLLNNENRPAVYFKDSITAFVEAIESGDLSETEESENFAGNYMYMGTWGKVDQFKHVDTREYLVRRGVNK